QASRLRRFDSQAGSSRYHRSKAITAIGLCLLAMTARAEVEPVQGLNSLPEVKLAQLSQQDINPLGAKALALHAEEWKHGETDHFIYHFNHSYVATPVSIEAEFHYRVVAKILEKGEVPSAQKSHIYVFERPEAWANF